MADPTASGATAATYTFAALIFSAGLPVVDPVLLICSFAGASIFVTHAKNVGLLMRSFYLFISTLIGYFLAPLIVNLPILQGYVGDDSAPIVASILSATGVTLLLLLIDKAQDGTIFNRG